MTTPPIPDTATIDAIVRRALDEDLPDVTTDPVFPASEQGSAYFLVKEPGVLAGLPFAARVFALLDASSRFEPLVPEGEEVAVGAIVARVHASVRALLSGERTALNLLQRASGIATRTRAFVRAVEGTGAAILDTRKTAPGLRVLDKYAVVAGGGVNHRVGLFDMVLLKNNHIDRAGSIHKAMELVRAAGGGHPVMIEVRDLRELDDALGESPDYILLDNMDLATMREAVRRTGRRVPLEASGGITLTTVRAIAGTGVERISVGELTHSVNALDISMRIEPAGPRPS